jgi:cytoskeletal protein RodZ
MTIEGLGKKFQDARIARGLTLDEAARLTKIRPARLAEIEADDFSQFPSLAYAKGFLLIYGKLLDVDVTPYLDVFETSKDVTFDSYSYLQDQSVPKPRRVRPSHAPTVRRHRMSSNTDRRSPWPVLIGIGVIILGFILMQFIMKIQRLGSHTHEIVGVPQSGTAESAAPQATPHAPSQPPAVAEAPKKSPPPVATVAPSIPIPEAFVPAFANAKAAAKTSAVPTEEPEVRRAEPVRPEDLAKTGATQSSQTTQVAQKASEAQRPNQVVIKPLKKTYMKVVVDNESLQPAFERWISPSDGTVEFRGQKFAVRVLDRDAIQIKKNGKPVVGGDEDITVE